MPIEQSYFWLKVIQLVALLNRREIELSGDPAVARQILNAREVDSSQVLASETVHDIAQAIEVDRKLDDLSNLRYNKICILADADSDGLHSDFNVCVIHEAFDLLLRKGTYMCPCHLFIEST